MFKLDINTINDWGESILSFSDSVAIAETMQHDGKKLVLELRKEESAFQGIKDGVNIF